MTKHPQTWASFLVCAVLMASHLSAAESVEGLKQVASREFKAPEAMPTIVGGRVVFSHYSEDGNNHDIVSINPTDGSSETLVSGARNARFVASDERYVIFTSTTPVARPLVVQDRLSGERLSSIRLRDGIVWGHIAGNRLLIIQAMSGNRTQSRAPALVLSLPDLKIEREIEVEGGFEVQLWNDKIIVVGRSVSLYDMDFNLISTAEFPARDPASLRSSCNANSLRIYDNQAILAPNCRQIAVYDLAPLRLSQAFSGLGMFSSFDIVDGLLYVTDVDRTQNSGIRVFEFPNRRELARFSVNAQFLAAGDGKLLALDQEEWRKPAFFSIFEPDLVSIRSDTVRVARVLQACGMQSGRGASARNPYLAIEECEGAGIRSYLDSAVSTPGMDQAFKNYGGWLASSLSRYEEAIPILERLDQTPEVASSLAIARRKIAYLGSVHTDALGRTLSSPAPQSAGAPEAAGLPGVTRRPLDFGAFSNLIHFSGDSVYVSRWDCGGKNGEVTLDRLDGRTLSLIKRLDVVACDEDYQDSISSMHLIPGFIVLGLAYRYEEQRPNVAIVNVETFEVTARNHIEAQVVTLGVWNGKLLRCATVTGEPHARLDTATARLVLATDEEALACLNGDVVMGTAAGYNPQSKEQGIPLFSTPSFKVHEGNGRYPLGYHRFVRSEGSRAETQSPERRYNQILAVTGKDEVILEYTIDAVRRFSRMDLRSQKETVLFDIRPTDPNVIVETWRDYLFVAMGRDLLVYDLSKNIMARVEKDFIAEGLEPVCGACNDGNGIRRMLLNGDWLLVLPLSGKNTRMVDLNSYVKIISDRDFFTGVQGTAVN